MSLLHGIPVVLLTLLSDSGAETRTWQTETVDNVLVAPYAETDGTRVLQPNGHQTVYHMAIPKGDAHQWEGALVQFFGETWAVVGGPTQGIDALIPGEWNKKVLVERYRTGAPSPEGLWTDTVTLLGDNTQRSASGYRRQTEEQGRDVTAIFVLGIDLSLEDAADKEGLRGRATAEVWSSDYQGEKRLRHGEALYTVLSAKNTGRGTRMLQLEEVWR